MHRLAALYLPPGGGDYSGSWGVVF